MSDADTGDGGGATPETGGWESLLFLLGLVAFLVSAVAFVADIVTGHDIVRSLVVNAAATLGLVAWAARDTLRDPSSAVDSRGGAASTGLLLYGLYLVVAAVVVAATSLWHDRLLLGLYGIVGGLIVILIGFVGFPRGRVLDDGATGSEEGPSEEADSGESRPRE